MKKIGIMFFLLVLCFCTKGNTQLSDNFLYLPKSPELCGTGRSSCYSGSVQSIWVNPAAGYLKRDSIYISHTGYMDEIYSENTASAFYIKSLSLQLLGAVSYVHSSAFLNSAGSDVAYSLEDYFSVKAYLPVLGVAFALDDDVVIGLNYKVLKIKMLDESFSHSFFDTGLMINNFISSIDAGISLGNFSKKGFNKNIGIRVPVLNWSELYISYYDNQIHSGFIQAASLKMWQSMVFYIAYDNRLFNYAIAYERTDQYNVTWGFSFNEIGMVNIFSIEFNF